MRWMMFLFAQEKTVGEKVTRWGREHSSKVHRTARTLHRDSNTFAKFTSTSFSFAWNLLFVSMIIDQIESVTITIESRGTTEFAVAEFINFWVSLVKSLANHGLGVTKMRLESSLIVKIDCCRAICCDKKKKIYQVIKKKRGKARRSSFTISPQFKPTTKICLCKF